MLVLTKYSAPELMDSVVTPATIVCINEPMPIVETQIDYFLLEFGIQSAPRSRQTKCLSYWQSEDQAPNLVVVGRPIAFLLVVGRQSGFNIDSRRQSTFPIGSRQTKRLSYW